MPEQTCNFWARLTVGWLFPLFRVGKDGDMLRLGLY